MTEHQLDPVAEPSGRDSARDRRLVIRLVIQALWRSRGIVVATCVLGTIFGLVRGLSSPNTYMSQAKLLLRLGEREQITGESLLGASVSRESSPTIEDEIHMLYDADVFSRVVRHVGPARMLEVEDPRDSDGDSTPIHVKAVHALQAALMSTGTRGGDLGRFSQRQLEFLATDALMRDTAIFAEHNSNVITVRTVSTSPGKAQYLAGLLVESFIDRHREQFSLDRYLPAYRERRDEARVEFDEARAALDRHIEQTGFLDVDMQRDLLLSSIAETDQSLSASRSGLEGLKREREITTDKLTNSRESLSATSYATMRDRLQSLDIEIPTREAAIEQQGAELKRFQDELVKLEESANVQDLLKAEIERTERLYREIAERLTKIEALAQIDVEGDTNLMPLQMPTLPLQKEGPKRMKLVVLGLAAGLALGFTIAVVRYFADPRVRFPEQLERDFEIQVLAAVPTLAVEDEPVAVDARRAA
ncbi:MAG: hypothetical protein R3F34_10785 [Planctomycetota bacterium]